MKNSTCCVMGVFEVNDMKFIWTFLMVTCVLDTKFNLNICSMERSNDHAIASWRQIVTHAYFKIYFEKNFIHEGYWWLFWEQSWELSSQKFLNAHDMLTQCLRLRFRQMKRMGSMAKCDGVLIERLRFHEQDSKYQQKKKKTTNGADVACEWTFIPQVGYQCVRVFCVKNRYNLHWGTTGW